MDNLFEDPAHRGVRGELMEKLAYREMELADRSPLPWDAPEHRGNHRAGNPLSCASLALCGSRAHTRPQRFVMFPKPKPALTPNTYAYESEPLVKSTGFREYDARWLLGTEINLMGCRRWGSASAPSSRTRHCAEIVTGHDFRGYSASVKMALFSGLMAAAARCTISASPSRPWPISPSSTSTSHAWRW